MAWRKGKRLVIVADDFGRTSAVNQAIAEAHENGIVTSASIMAGGEAFDEAVRIARRSNLSVGLHLTLCDGNAVLPASKIPGIVDGKGLFEKSPARAWIRYFGAGFLRQVDKEIKAQFEVLEKSGIHPTHVDSHHHLHMHPGVFALLCRQAANRNVPWIRLPHEPLSMVLQRTGRGMMPVVEWSVFRFLGLFLKKEVRMRGLQLADAVYGLSRTGHIDEQYLLALLDRPGEVIEIFLHPDSSTLAGRREIEALVSPAVRDRVASLGIRLSGYRELSGEDVHPGMGTRPPGSSSSPYNAPDAMQ